jgi:hypothetical protein
MSLRDIGRPLLWFVIGLAVAAVPLFLHRNQQSGNVVRSYSVAPEIARELKGALAEAVPPGIGFVSQTPDGHILVTAPESIQEGVQNIVAEVAAKKPPPTPTIHFEVWLVTAVPAAGATDNEPGLAEVRPALATIQKAKGPLRFELIENLALQARAGNDSSTVQGARAGLEVAPTVRYDAKGEPVIAARINVRLVPRPDGNLLAQQGSLKALTELRPGQLLVIGQGTVPAKNSAERDSQIYYIVRASL